MRTLILYPLLSVLLSTACHSSKKSTDSEATSTTLATETNNQETTTGMQQKSQGDNTYRFIASFISIGEGTDPKAREILDRVLKGWEIKKGKPLEMETVPWGREGEVDFCFKLNELNPSEQSEFVTEMRTAFEGKSLIQMSENQSCVHKR